MSKIRNDKGQFVKTGKNKNCLFCDSKFYVCESIKNKKFCSYKCYHNSMKGKKQPKEYVLKRAISNTGKKRTQESKNKISNALKGSNNGAWRGGISYFRKRQIKQPKYRKWRKEIFERDNYTCQKCGQRGDYLEAHHIKPYAYFKELQYNMDNGITLCKKCHKKETIKERKINWSNQFIKRKPDLNYWVCQ